MTSSRLILRSLVHFRRTNLGVALGVAVAAAVLVGALLVGDSVRYSLKRIAIDRLGQTDYALPTGDRLVTTGLAERLDWDDATFAGVLQLPGVVSADGGKRRVNNINILGVDEEFWSLAPKPDAATGPAPDGVVLNERLANELGAKVGDRIVLRIAKPSALPRDIPIGSEVADSISLNATVTAIADADGFGLYSLQGSQIPPLNAFVPLERLQQAAGVGERVNTVLAAASGGRLSLPDQIGGYADSSQASLTESLRSNWTLTDAGGELRKVGNNRIELRSRRIFLDPALADAALGAVPGGTPILTYFANSLEANGKATPYSMVSTRDAGLANDEVEIVQWLADDLGAKVGDRMTLRYFVIGEDDALVERSSEFTVKRIAATEGPGGDRDLMPEFPGLTDVDDARDWEPGIPIDRSRIRDKDEDYWDEHRGAPKAFVSLAFARKTWGNRFGSLTQIRWTPGSDLDTMAREIASKLDPRDLGLVWQPVRAQATEASAGGTDFGGLFIGLSFFLVVAALLLVGLLFVFGVEQRAAQTGVLTAMGYTHRQVRRLWLGEGLVLAVIGTAIGVPAGMAYTGTVLWALSTRWAGAVAQTRLWFHAEPTTVAIGAASSVIVAVVTMAWVLRRQLRRSPRELMAAKYGGATEPAGATGTYLGVACIVGAIALGAAMGAAGGGGGAAAGGFFGAGALLLIGSVLLCRAWIGRLGASAKRFTMATLARRNTGRRRGRSLAVVTLLACGCFLVVAINAFRHDPTAHAERRSSGTGGFAWFVTTTIPLHDNPSTEAGRRELELEGEAAERATYVAARVRGGDDASCLNLNKPRTPPLLGVDPAAMKGRFTFVRMIENADDPWALLEGDVRRDAPGIATPQAAEGAKPQAAQVPAIVDDAVAQWILKVGVGDSIEYTDDAGRAVRVRIVATTAASILQGYVVVSEAAMKRHFPSASGYRVVMVEPPGGTAQAVREAIEFSLEDHGVSVTGAAERLAMFTAVEATYLTIFGVLGGLGVLLGSVGLGLVVMRNVLERRGELALMRAVGFGRGRLRRLVLGEHWALAGMGLMCGVAAAGVAIAPALVQRSGDVPWGVIGWTLIGVGVSAGVWTAVAAGMALRGSLMRGLRSE